MKQSLKTTPQPQSQSTAGNSVSLPFKNRLQEYTQRAAIALPVYETKNEGSQQAPMFRSTVIVNGVHYTSPNTFPQRKMAEQDVARVALLQKIKEYYLLIKEDAIFCKSILNEFAAKTHVEKPNYTTNQSDGLLPVFVSSLYFNGKHYDGEKGKSKREAEQLAARAAILSILDFEPGFTLSEIIKSKVKLYAAILNKVEHLSLKQPALDSTSARKRKRKNKAEKNVGVDAQASSLRTRSSSISRTYYCNIRAKLCVSRKRKKFYGCRNYGMDGEGSSNFFTQSNLKDKVGNSNEDIMKLTKENEKLKEEMMQLREEVRKSEIEVAQGTKKNEKLKKEMMQLIEEVTKSEIEVAQGTKKNEKLKEEIMQLREKVTKSEIKVAQGTKKNEKLKEEMMQLREEVTKSEIEVAQGTKKNEKLKEEMMQLREKVTKSEIEVAQGRGVDICTNTISLIVIIVLVVMSVKKYLV